MITTSYLGLETGPILPRGELDQPAGNCGASTGIKGSLRISPTINIGDDRKPPIGPHSQVQNASAISTARAFSSSRRPIMVGVTKCPSRNVSPTKASGAIRPPLSVENDITPTAVRTTNVATGPMIGKKFRVAASAPSPAGFGIPVAAQMIPVAAPTPRLIAVTINR